MVTSTDGLSTWTRSGIDLSYRILDGDIAAGWWILVCARTAADAWCAYAARTPYCTALNDDVTAVLDVSDITTTTADACTMFMAFGKECSVTRNGKGGTWGYEDARVAGAEAFDIVRPTNDDGGIA